MNHLRVLCLGWLLMIGLSAHAAIPAAELQALRDGSARITTQYFMYTILERARERQSDVKGLITDLDTRVAALNDPELLNSWQAVRAAALTDPYVKGAVYQQTIYTLEDRNAEFAQILEKRMPPELGRDKRQLYELAGRMQVMMIIYLRNSADAFGGVNYSGKQAHLDLTKLAKEFSTLLATVSTKQQASMAPALKKIKPKWIFLAPRMLDYQKNNVPFIVDLYGCQIIEQLLAAAGS